MRHFFVITNKAKDHAVAVSEKIRDYLTAKGATCVLDPSDPEQVKEGYTDRAFLPEDTDCVVVLGGDGTLLQASHDLNESEIPFLGINFGTLGFLSEAPADDAFVALDRVLADDHAIEERMMISGEIRNASEEKECADALNDIVITRKGSLQILSFTVFVNGQLIHKYNADGLIVATPTGSTGYSLSAGGPIINPVSRMIMLTPVSPHSLHNRSILFSADDEISIRIDTTRDGREQELEVLYDGSHKVTVRTGDEILIRASHRTTKIIKLYRESFLETLQKKLKDE